MFQITLDLNSKVWKVYTYGGLVEKISVILMSNYEIIGLWPVPDTHPIGFEY